ncbi:hypothetical protein FHJ30_12980 [Arthrobacter sp. BB-1]|uniref:hypothetical protein n=1 Tax=unclassified Arthrobacter TaxID=235627 RepID=UPI00111194CF|nr:MULTISPECIES: hypothetical protein [unclassified Arthrobacter]TNB71595.1 hypothetical protein FHJ30_12980 [Arthrobacter sp. BB-1]
MILDVRVQRKLASLLARAKTHGVCQSWTELLAIAEFLPSEFLHLPFADSVAAIERASLERRGVKEGIDPALADGVL